MSCRASNKYEGADFVCDNALSLGKDGVFINTLHDSMPECDHATRSVTLDELSSKDPVDCYVYCAQRTCDASTNFMKKNKEELSQKCRTVSYVPGGALEMDPASLKDGSLCRANTIRSNLSKGLQDGCLTCKGDERVKVDMTINDVKVNATYLKTSGEVPDWYQRAGISGTLPTQFYTDCRYKTKAPVPHDNGGDMTVKVDISKTNLPKNAVLAYWGAKPSTNVPVAERAYGSFHNSGIVKCEDSVCEFLMQYPGRYTSEGKVFKSHFHVTEWLGDRWNMEAKTIDIE